jgi:S-disulfanyl-L-cysteine oxidoreductase SoxD
LRAKLFIPAILLTCALSYGFSRQTQAVPAKTVLDSIFTLAQAERGEKEYEANCTRCHEGNDPEGPTLFGRTFVDRWREDDLEVLFNYMRLRMPAGTAHSLPDKSYLEILAFLLDSNGYPHGTRELTIDSMPGIRFVGPDGPKPLPNNTLVHFVGCLTETSTGEWSATRATPPVRLRPGTETPEDELKKAQTRPLGNESLRVQNFANIRFDFKPEPLKGHKVHVKGVLIRQSNTERISLTSLESLGSTCQ